MTKLGGREFVALLLILLVAAPPRIAGAATSPATRAVLGSIESRGAVRIGEVLTPTQNTLFAGDRVQTNNGGAVIQYREGARVVLASETVANFAPARVQLEKGLMTFESASNGSMIFAASTLRLEPASSKTAANITLSESKASVAVTQGTLKVVDPSGLQLASLNAGDARMFEEAPATSEPASASAPSAPSAPGAPPQAGSGSHKWVIALGAAVVGASLGIAGLVRANDANSRADSSASAAAALQAQVQAAQATAATLQARLSAVGSDSANVAALNARLAAQIAALAQAQSQLATIVSQLAAGTLTPAAAATQLAALQNSISQATNLINQISQILQACVNAINSAVTSTGCVVP